MSPGARIDYKTLRQINPEAARQAVLEYLKTSTVVYDILKKAAEGDLQDRPKTPKHQPNKTPLAVEQKVIALRNKTRLGPQRLSIYLAKHQDLQVPPGTIRHILRRNKEKLTYATPRRRKREKREFIDWYSAKPFEVVQMDIKYIRDQKALTKEQIIHLDKCAIPNYQWGALDVNSRFKLIAYSREKSWTNGLCFYLWVISWLRSNGVTAKIVFTVDNGEEFGGKSWVKIRDLRKLISGFGCRLIQNHKGHPEENAHLERSHRTDDDEFYRLRALRFHSEKLLLEEALHFIYYYNNVREHSSLDYLTPFAHLKQQDPDVNDDIRFFQPFILDDVSVELGPWSGYNLLAQHLVSQIEEWCWLGLPFLVRSEVNLTSCCLRKLISDGDQDAR
jgi:transposase InsO family protein